jgi:ATP-dependent helicase HepA
MPAVASKKNRTVPLIVPGQRWLSEAERELGLGTIVEVDDRSLVVAFIDASENKRYAIRSAPLRRVRFATGDTIIDKDGRTLRVDNAAEKDGLMFYSCGGNLLPEYEISDRVELTGPKERLLSGRTAKPHRFDLRVEALNRLHDIRKSPVRGFVGPRLEMIPHQFFIASEVTSRPTPRVLLADETGLGKTIEACLTINRLILTGRASRVLILTPDSLVHQWLVEQRRRFNLRFALFDEDRCAAAESATSDSNPFSSEQLILAGLNLVASSPERTAQAALAGWDVVVVDEAHHLVQEGEKASSEYAAVRSIADNSRGLLLLTATPQQLGERSHFARLQLLDPQRYDDFDRWKDESRRYQEVARLGQQLIEGGAPSASDAKALAEVLGDKPAEVKKAVADDKGKAEVLDRLIDRHGPGRAMFRNTRAAMPRFPERVVKVHALPPGADPTADEKLQREIAAGFRGPDQPDKTKYKLDGDPRVDYLLELLATDEPRKLLIFCSNAKKAQAIKDAIERTRRIDIAVFHEDLTLVQRDRNAAWFAELDGARVMICSEIGSEGRNFQHAQHLLMFDLPIDPDLMEQRIGRLDRIGQKGVVNIDVPYIAGSGMEVVARWHHEGVNVFTRPTTNAPALLERFASDVISLATFSDSETLDAQISKIVDETRKAHEELKVVVEAGRDRLLEMASLRQPRADELVAAVQAAAADDDFEDFALRLLEGFHVYAEGLSPHCYLLNPDSHRAIELHSLGAGKRTVTFDREIALVREDFEFISWDHPLVADAIEHLCATDRGNACFATVKGPAPARMLLEAVFVLESVAPPSLHVGRFLPPTPIRMLSDHKGRTVEPADAEVLSEEMDICPSSWIVERQDTLRKMLDTMLTSARERAEKEAAGLRTQAGERLRDELAREARRLHELAEVNDQVDADDAQHVEREMAELEGHIERARLRLDCTRLVWVGPPLST